MIGPYYFRVPDPPHLPGVAVLRHRIACAQGRHPARQGRQPPSARRSTGGIDLYQEYRTTTRRGRSVVVHNTPQGPRSASTTTSASTCRTRGRFNRLTINPGIRFEFFNTYVPEQVSPAGRFVPARPFDKIENLPNWRDVAPRLGLVYDVFGDWRTAHQGATSASTCARSRRWASPRSTTRTCCRHDRRTWADLNGDDIAQDNEIGPVVHAIQHQRHAAIGSPDPDIKRPYQWEYNAGIQRELFARRADFVELGAPRLQAHVLERQHPRVARATTPSSTSRTRCDPAKPCRSTTSNVAKRGQVAAGGQELGPRTSGLVQRLRHRLHRARRAAATSTAATARPADHGHLRGGGSEQPAVLRSARPRHPVPDAVQARRHISAAVRGSPSAAAGRACRACRSARCGRTSSTVAALNRVPDPSLNVELHRRSRTQIPNAHAWPASRCRCITPGEQYLDRWNQIDMRLAKSVDDPRVKMQGAVRHLQPAQRQHDPERPRHSDRRWIVRRRFSRGGCTASGCSSPSRPIHGTATCTTTRRSAATGRRRKPFAISRRWRRSNARRPRSASNPGRRWPVPAGRSGATASTGRRVWRGRVRERRAQFARHGPSGLSGRAGPLPPTAVLHFLGF